MKQFDDDGATGGGRCGIGKRRYMGVSAGNSGRALNGLKLVTVGGMSGVMVIGLGAILGKRPPNCSIPKRAAIVKRCAALTPKLGADSGCGGSCPRMCRLSGKRGGGGAGGGKRCNI